MPKNQQALDQDLLDANTVLSEASTTLENRRTGLTEAKQKLIDPEERFELAQIESSEEGEAFTQARMDLDSMRVEDLVALGKEASLEKDETDKPLEFNEALEKKKLSDSKQRLAGLVKEEQERVDRAENSLRSIRATVEDLQSKQKVAEEALAAAMIEYDGKAHAREQAVEAAHHGVKKRARFLYWDGTRSAAGACNTRTTGPADALLTQQRDDLTRRPPPLYVSSDGKQNVVQTPNTVSVRIRRCTDTAAAAALPVVTGYWCEIDLKRMERIETLLLQVLDQHGTPIYSELLDVNSLDRLPLAQPLPAATEQEKHDRLAHLDRPLASAADGPYRFSIWASNAAGDFTALPAVEQYGSRVSDKAVRAAVKQGGNQNKLDQQTQEAARDAIGKNQVGVPDVRLVSLAMMALTTAHESHARDNRSAADKIIEVGDSVTAANTAWGAVQGDELRVLLGPEWNFQKFAKPWTHSAIEKDDLIQRTEALSGTPACNQWLLAPGTILWGQAHATRAVTLVNNTLVFAAAGARVHLYNKQNWGGDTEEDPSYRPNDLVDGPYHLMSVVASKRAAFSRQKQLNKGTLPKSLKSAMCARWSLSPIGTFTVHQTTVGDWHVEYATGHTLRFFNVHKVANTTQMEISLREIFAGTVDTQPEWNAWVGLPNMAAWKSSPFFTHSNLRFAIEICADTRAAEGPRRYTTAHGTGIGPSDGVDVQLITSCSVAPQSWKAMVKSAGLWAYLDGTGPVTLAKTFARLRPVTDLSANTLAAHAMKHAGARHAAADPGGMNTTSQPFVASRVQVTGPAPSQVFNLRLVRYLLPR